MEEERTIENCSLPLPFKPWISFSSLISGGLFHPADRQNAQDIEERYSAAKRPSADDACSASATVSLAALYLFLYILRILTILQVEETAADKRRE